MVELFFFYLQGSKARERGKYWQTTQSCSPAEFQREPSESPAPEATKAPLLLLPLLLQGSAKASAGPSPEETSASS